MTKICASCLTDLTDAKEDGISSLYSNRNYILCVTCFFEEDKLIEKRGTNDIPEEVKRYQTNLQEYGLL